MKLPKLPFRIPHRGSIRPTPRLSGLRLRPMAVAGFIALAIFSYQIGYRGLGWGISAEEIQLPDPTVLNIDPQSFQAIDRNPFDSSQTPWTGDVPSEGSGETPKPSGGSVKGIIQLPGVTAAFTDRGLVVSGQALGNGKLKGIAGDNLILETAEGDQPLPLNRPPRRTLESLNRAGKQGDVTQ